ncbi:MAG: hypothetical protein IJ062_02720 [Firmicutes bacterium]|nr:hypothetical protein [Bacillota bacterium]
MNKKLKKKIICSCVLIICIIFTYSFLLYFKGIHVLYPPATIQNIEKAEMLFESHQICYNDDKVETITYMLTKNRVMYTIVGDVKPLDHENIQSAKHYLTIERIIKQKISVKDYTIIEELYNKINGSSDDSLIYASKELIGITYEAPPYNNCVIIAYNKKLLFESDGEHNYTRDLMKKFSQMSKLNGTPVRYKWQHEGDDWLIVQN